MIGYLVCLGIMVGSVVMVALSMYLVDVTADDGDSLNLTNLQLSLTSIIYYQDSETGEYLEYQRLDGSENRIWVDLEDIPQHVIDAYIAVEDKDFYEHNGVNIVRTVAAMINEYTPIKLFSSKTGASTITQQLVKNLTNDNSGSGIGGAFRKIREIYRAFILEKQYSKDEILEAYLNTLRLSHNWAGVQAGANNYFGKDVSELTIAEAASIAGITKNPSVYNPYSYPENNKERRDDILYFMHEQGKITDEEYEDALAEELVLNQDIRAKSYVNSYFTDMVINQVVEDLMDQYGMTQGEATDYLYNDGLKIYSTVDPKVQSAMEEVMLNEPNSSGKTLFPTKENTYTTASGEKVTQTPQAAMVSVDYNGGVVGVVGGLGEKTEDRVLNRAVDSLRQTGSTMKPIGSYGPALEYDYIHFSTALFDDYITEIDDNTEPDGKRKWPRNYNDQYTMQLTPVCYALAKSWNTIAVRTLMLMGVDTSYDFLVNSVGISSLTEADRNYAPLALGGLSEGISPLEMAAAYAIFGNGGKYIEPYCYTTVEDSTGEVILETKITSVQALSEETAYIMNRMMKNVLTYGTGAGLAPRYTDAVGKTGTTSDDKDHWFIGVTPYYSTAVWMGYDNPAVLTITNYSSHPPTTAWKQVTEAVHKDLPTKSFPVSKDVEMLNYCPVTGNIANANCPDQQPGYYKKSTIDSGFVVVCQTH